MGYKSKKINRKKNRRQSRKRIYGGASTLPTKNGVMISESSSVNNINTNKEELPTLMSNLKGLGNLAVSYVTNVVADNIKSSSESLGLDPNKDLNENLKEGINKTLDAVKDINEVMSSSEGKELLKETGEIAKNVVKTLEPAAEESMDIVNDLIKKEMPIITDMGEKLVLGMPGIGTAVAAAEEVIDATAAASTAAAAVAKLTEKGTETLNDLNEQKSKIESIIDKGVELYNNTNKGVNNIVSSVQTQVDNYGKSISKRQMEYEPGKIDDSLKKYQKEKIMIGGRISQSQLEFLTPRVNRSQFMKVYGDKWNTKRHHSLKRRLTSRKH